MHNNLPKVFIFLDHYNNQIFKNNITNIGIIYRNYNDSKRETELIKIAKACKKNRYQLFVSNDIKLAIKVRSDGIYIPSFNKKKGFLNLENKNFVILGSAHNQIEIQEKISQKCSAIFLSPVFNVKKSKKYLGINKFNLLSHSSKVSVLALGGINQNNMRKLKMLHINGFGGIRIFKKKPAYKRPVFLKNNFF
jgi:thiamine-phosphate pyrophosphorylase